MNKIYESRGHIVENYKFYNKILPKGYLKVHFKPLSYYDYNVSLIHLPNYIFKYNKKSLSPYQKSVILRSDNKIPYKSNKKNSLTSRFNVKSLDRLDLNDDLKRIKNSTKKNLTKTVSTKIFDSTMLNICQSHSSNNFKSHGVKVFYTKNNLYLPSITERLKKLKPRYEREELNFKNGYQTLFN